MSAPRLAPIAEDLARRLRHSAAATRAADARAWLPETRGWRRRLRRLRRQWGVLKSRTAALMCA
jgi:hypothetical protein